MGNCRESLPKLREAVRRNRVQGRALGRMATIQTEIDRHQRRLSEIRQDLDHLTDR